MTRSSGILLPVSALPSPCGIGDLGTAAREFIDFLAAAGQRYWQILPLNPPDSAHSPYLSASTFAGSTDLLSPEPFMARGALTADEVRSVDWGGDPMRVDYGRVHAGKTALWAAALAREQAAVTPALRAALETQPWLMDYCLYMAIKEAQSGAPWYAWPSALRDREPDALAEAAEQLDARVLLHAYLQTEFTRQWDAVRAYAHAHGVRIIGDLPMYVAADSADVWAKPGQFCLDPDGQPSAVAGVPPDYFCADGQLWGNPLYAWDIMKADGFRWWKDRVQGAAKRYDVVRIDHFRGFDEYFSIPAGDTTAKNGHWEKGPGMDFFRTLYTRLGDVNVIAEDLGLMTDGVRQLVRDSGCPNMKVLQFAVDPADVAGSNDYWPHNYNSNCVVYTGTHDNETVAGWYRGLSKAAKQQLRDYLCDYHTPDNQMFRVLIALTMRAVAKDCIIPVQDYLGLGNEARMNQPGTVGFNWRWRLTPGQLTDTLAEEMLALVKRTGRANWDAIEKKTKKA